MTNSLISLSQSAQRCHATDFKKFPYAHDFVLDGKPQTFARNSEGQLIPAVGSEVTTRYGKGFIERRHIGGQVVIRITEFNKTAEIAQYANPVEVNAIGVVKGYLSAEEYVARLSSAYNNRTMNKAIWFETRLSDMLASERLMELVLDDDCYLVTLNGAQDYLGATTFVYGASARPTKNKVTPAQLAYRAKMEALRTDDVVPEGIEDELAECFGE